MIHQRSLTPFITPQFGPAHRENEPGTFVTVSRMVSERYSIAGPLRDIAVRYGMAFRDRADSVGALR